MPGCPSASGCMPPILAVIEFTASHFKIVIRSIHSDCLLSDPIHTRKAYHLQYAWTCLGTRCICMLQYRADFPWRYSIWWKTRLPRNWITHVKEMIVYWMLSDPDITIYCIWYGWFRDTYDDIEYPMKSGRNLTGSCKDESCQGIHAGYRVLARSEFNKYMGFRQCL